MSIKAEEKFCEVRSDTESAIDDLFKAGEAAGFTAEQVLDDIADAIFNAKGIKVNISIE